METTTTTFSINDEIVHRLQSTRFVFWVVRAVFPEGISVEGASGKVGSGSQCAGFIATKDLEMYELR